MENENKGSTIGAGLSFSSEFDYKSFGANINFAQKTKNRNGADTTFHGLISTFPASGRFSTVLERRAAGKFAEKFIEMGRIGKSKLVGYFSNR